MNVKLTLNVSGITEIQAYHYSPNIHSLKYVIQYDTLNIRLSFANSPPYLLDVYVSVSDRVIFM